MNNNTFYFAAIIGLLLCTPTIPLIGSQNYGIYWGTFDPPTRAHQQVILQAFSTGIDRLFVVVNNHGHKKYTASIEDRVAMLKLILPPKYPITVLIQDVTHKWSMEELKDTYGNYPTTCWYLFSGQENLAYWDPEDGDPYDTVFIIPRGTTRAILPDSVIQLPIPSECNKISSSAVRAAIKNGEQNWHSLITEPVQQFITEQTLYY